MNRSRDRRGRLPETGGDGPTRSLFFTNVWRYGALAALLLGMASGQRALTLLALLVLATAGVAWGWNRLSLRGVAYERTFSATRAFPDDTLTLTLGVVNRKPLPLPWLIVEEELGDGLRVLDRPTIPSGAVGRQLLRIATSVRPFERVTWRVTVACPTRGVHPVGPTTLRSGDLFAFFTNRSSPAAPSSILVYPRVVPLTDLGFPARRPFGETRVARHLLTDPTRVVGVRDYRPEDPFRAVHWKATARQGRLQVRVYEPTTALQLGIFLNLDTFERYWEGLDVELTERGIVAAASLAVWATGQRYAVGVYANGLVAGSDQPLRIAPGRGPAQLPRIMEGLAKLTPYSTLPVARTLRTAVARFPWGSTVVVITPQLPDALTAVLAKVLAAGHGEVLVALVDC